MSEEEIIAGCRNGQRAAQHELYARTVDRIYRLLLRMTGSADDAFDLAQDTYLRAFATIDRFRGQSTLLTWLYRIAVNECLQWRRRARTHEKYRRTASQHGGNGRVADPASAVDVDVQAALNRLDEADRAVLLLRYDQGLGYREIAELLDSAEGTVASRLNRARGRLRELLKSGYGPTEEPTRAVHPTGGEESDRPAPAESGWSDAGASAARSAKQS